MPSVCCVSASGAQFQLVMLDKCPRTQMNGIWFLKEKHF